MLGGILQGFLQNTEETQCDLLWQFFRDVFGVKVNLHTVPFGVLPAKAGRRRCEPQKPQLGGVQAMCESLNRVSKFCDLVAYSPDLLRGFSRQGGQALLQAL